MKICKVEILKKLDGALCTNIYPNGYNPHTINIVAYDENPLDEGDNVGYCIGLVADNFAFTDKMVEIDQIEANSFIDARAAIIVDAEKSTKFANTRKQIIADAV